VNRSLSGWRDRIRREPSTLIPPPPLSTWQHVWRTGAAILIGLAAWSAVVEAQVEQKPLLFWIDPTLGIVALVLMQYRRRWPLPIALLLVGICAVSTSGVGAMAVASISLATRRRWSEIVPLAIGQLLSSPIYSAIQPRTDESGPWWVDLLFAVFATGVLIAMGMYIGARRDLLATLKDRAERAEREQAMRVAQARTNERARIAREMHDVLAHRISLVAMHAGAMTYRTDLSHDETRRAVEVIRDNAHRALADLREVLGMLREDQAGAAPSRPQPTLRDIPELIAEAATSGMNVRFTDDVGDIEPPPDTVGRSAYRIIQESLTNARKHAPNTAVDVRLSGEPGGDLTVEIRNPLRVGDRGDNGALPESGLGLIGLVERAELSGGRLEHGRTAGREFFVRARLPWPDPVVAGGES
jgi:signal transduction histidine kinase